MCKCIYNFKMPLTPNFLLCFSLCFRLTKIKVTDSFYWLFAFYFGLSLSISRISLALCLTFFTSLFFPLCRNFFSVLRLNLWIITFVEFFILILFFFFYFLNWLPLFGIQRHGLFCCFFFFLNGWMCCVWNRAK